MGTHLFMDFGFVVLLLMHLLPSPVLAQSFYPMQIGNRWDYHETSTTYPGGIVVDQDVSTSIVDTLTLNGKHYFLFTGAEVIGGGYLRADSGWIYYCDDPHNAPDVPFFKLDALPSEAWEPHFRGWDEVWLELRDTISQFGTQTRLMAFGLWGGVMGSVSRELYITERFGPLNFREEISLPGHSTWVDRNLLGAIIADTVYGTLVNVPTNNLPRSVFLLKQNFPNPFNASTTIEFITPRKSQVSMSIFDVLGRKVETLYSGEIPAGPHTLHWHAAGLASGCYFYRLTAPGWQETKMMMIQN